MDDSITMTKVLGDLMIITDPRCLKIIQTAAFNRRRDLDHSAARIITAAWQVDDDVQMLPQHRNAKPYGAKGKILKINKVKIRIDFGNNLIYNVPKTMLMKAE